MCIRDRLWGMLLQNFSSQEQELDDKFTELIPFLKYGVETHSEILPTLLEIIKSYALILNSEQFFANITFQDIFKQMSKYLLKLREDSFQLVLEIWEILILSDVYKRQIFAPFERYRYRLSSSGSPR